MIPYVVYKLDGDLYKQNYKANQKKRSVVLVGEPEKVVEKYVGISASGIPQKTQMKVSPIEQTMQLHAAGSGTGAGSAGPGTGAPGSSLGNGSGSPKMLPAIKSGGPGSGRHPEGGYSRHDALGSNGWKTRRGTGNTFTHSNHSGHEIKVSGNDKWTHHSWHGDKFKTVSQGRGGESLGKHLTRFHNMFGSSMKATAATSSSNPSGGGYAGYQKASRTQSDKTRGASKSEMFDKLKGSGYTGYSDATKEQSDKTRGAKSSKMFDELKGAAKIKKIITDYKAAVKAGYKASSKDMQAVAPPGLEHMVKGLKKHFGEDSAAPYKIAWWKHGQGGGKKK